MKGSNYFRFSLVLAALILQITINGSIGCGGGTTTTGSTGCTDCDFFVVENFDGTADAGKLSRVDPSVPSKETVVSGLTNPIDFVVATSSYGYLSACPGALDGTSGGQVWRVDFETNTKVTVADTTSLVCPKGIDVQANITGTNYGCSATVQDVVLIADEGPTDGGTIWALCVTDAELHGIVASSVLENPRGVAFQSESVFVAVGKQPSDSTVGGLTQYNVATLTADLLSDSNSCLGATCYSSNLKDMTIDSNGSILIVDANLTGVDGMIFRHVSGTGTALVQDGLDNPRDILPTGKENYPYFITEYTQGSVMNCPLLTGLSTSTCSNLLGSSVSLDHPEGIADVP
ncbi:MAG: hypothetical protein HYU97_00420 [Deltaproteobacteria bacterium]|nr:hypothetical protein [Deltaproteobacteria bacterium]